MTAKPASLIQKLEDAINKLSDRNELEVGQRLGLEKAQSVIEEHFASPEVVAGVAEALYLSEFPRGKFDIRKHKRWLQHGKAALKAAVGDL